MDSYLDHPGEWQTRKINIFGAVKSFISQLSIGQDLTKVSLPAAFLYPYSALELGAHRTLHYCTELEKVSSIEDPLQRMFQCVIWFLNATQKEKFEKKPYNPILGEFHFCWVESENGTTRYLAEQVVHHPPILAFVVENKKAEFVTQANISFVIKFHGNSVSVGTAGANKMFLKKYNENYIFSSVLPNVAIKNVIIGTKRVAWDGDVSVHCPETGYRVTMTFKEEGWSCINTVSGKIFKAGNDNPIYTFHGPCGGVVTLKDCQTDEEKILLDYASLEPCSLKYPPPEAVDDRYTLKLWSQVSKAIYEDDTPSADAAKRVIEEAQRKRRAEGANFEPRFFEFNSSTNFWEYRPDKVDSVMKSVQQKEAEIQLAELNLSESQEKKKKKHKKKAVDTQ